MEHFRVILVFALLALASSARAQDSEPTAAPEAGIVDQIVTASFEPKVFFLLKEAGRGQVKQYKATALELREIESDPGMKKFIIGSYVPENPSHDFHFSFFLAGDNSAFAASEIKLWTTADLNKNTTSIQTLEERTAELEAKIRTRRGEGVILDENLATVRDKASEIAGVDKIVKLKTKLSQAEQSSTHDQSELERIKVLTEQGRELEDPEDIDAYRLDLSNNLEEAAKVTAVAERLNQRKKESAVRNFMKKVELVKQMDAADPDALAREVLQLRKKRRELENRLGITSPDLGAAQEF